MSPSEAHVAPDEAQRPLWQLPEQQSPLPPHVFPSVPHPPAATGAQAPFVQLFEQQSLPAHTFVQHSVGCVHDAPAPMQDGPATPQIFEVGSQVPEQQLAPFAQASPGPAQLTPPDEPPLPPPWVPAVPVPPFPAAPPSPLLRADDELPQLPARSTSAAMNPTRAVWRDRSVMTLGAPSTHRRLK